MKQGLKENLSQFILLVVVNAFVGSMIGMERSVLPELASRHFGLDIGIAVTSFIAAFGLSKAFANLLMGKVSHFMTRKSILLVGWLFALPVPWILMYAESWWQVIVANALLGVNQGLAWSATVIMKVDLAGQKQRGLAMGINEFAGYLFAGLAAWFSAEIASAKGFAFYPFIPGIFFSVIGILLSLLFVKDTQAHVHHESLLSMKKPLQDLWKSTTWTHPNLGSVNINGLVNNANDGILWGLLPAWLLANNYSISQVGLVAGLYPVVWGMSQLFTGKMGDVFCKKQLITIGMFVQALGILLFLFVFSFPLLIIGAVLLGAGTALVYPNFLSEVADNTHPSQRAQVMSIFRFWRDMGYVAGALVSGLMVASVGFVPTLIFTAIITGGAGLLANARMCCTLKKLWHSETCLE